MQYRFKLEALLKVRYIEEEKCQKELADTQIMVETELFQFEHLLKRQSAAERQMRDRQDAAMTGQETVLHLRYMKKISHEIIEQQNKITEAKSAFEKCRIKLNESIKRRKAIEKLKEKDLLKYHEKVNCEEQKFINEMAINRFCQIQE